MVCDSFCTVCCIDGTCPIALYEQFGGDFIDPIKSCRECPYFTSCEDCDLLNTDYCKFYKGDK